MNEVYAGALNTAEYIEKLSFKLPQLAEFGIKVVAALLFFWIGSRLIQKVIHLFRNHLLKFPLAVGMVTFGCSMLKIGLYLLMILALAMWLGVRQTSIAALLGTVGVTVGLALQGGLSNVAGGVILLVFKPFQVGDYIVCTGAGFEGVVLKIELFYTTLETRGFQRTVIPNSLITSQPLVNETVEGKRQMSLSISVAYDTDLAHAKEVLLGILAADPEAGKDPNPLIFVDSFEDSAILLEVRARVDKDQAAVTKWRLHEQIQKVFRTEGIRIPFPQMDVHIQREE